ncbi:MAG: hypothetical protein WBD63_00160 [Phycisphaerae bacterium]|nr:hypothetical protein [Phycisphaerae bacterium]
MRRFPAFLLLVALFGCGNDTSSPQQGVATQQGLAVPPNQAVLGSWRSEDFGLDFPIWMVDTYMADGTVKTDFFSKPRGQVIHHTDKTMHRHWRIRDDALEVGTLAADRSFHIEGQPRPIETGASGNVISIKSWTREK